MISRIKLKEVILCGGDQTVIEPPISFLSFIEQIIIAKNQ
jgi:hypothetical protein